MENSPIPKRYDYKLCSKCHNLYKVDRNADNKKCQLFACYGDLVEIDEAIIPIIKTLWDKGYETIACCSGHIWDKDIYIMFKENYKFEKYPKGFEVEHHETVISFGHNGRSKGSIVTILRGEFKNKKVTSNIIETQKILNKHLSILLEWVDDLKNNE